MLFTCDICSKVFTEKRTLMRHTVLHQHITTKVMIVSYARNHSNEKTVYDDINYLFIEERMRLVVQNVKKNCKKRQFEEAYEILLCLQTMF